MPLSSSGLKGDFPIHPCGNQSKEWWSLPFLFSEAQMICATRRTVGRRNSVVVEVLDRARQNPVREGFLFGFEKTLKVVDARGVPQFAQRLGFDLADALPSHVIYFPDFLERVAVAIRHAKAH